MATLTNLANLPTPVNLAISAKPAILALLSTMATLANPGYFFFCSWNSWTGETRPKGKGQFQEEHSIQFSKPNRQTLHNLSIRTRATTLTNFDTLAHKN